jgi:nucleotide-binding universal stress UspA family protein
MEDGRRQQPVADSSALQKILVAWDGSRPSAATFPLADVVGRQLAAKVEILHILRPEASGDDVARNLREVLDGLDASSLRIESGEVVQTIVAKSAEPDVIMVVLTTDGTAIEHGSHLGSVAKGVIVGTTKPVLLVRPAASWTPRELRRLLLPVDGTPKTAAALKPAAELARRLGAALDLLHVAGPQGQAPEERGSIGAPRYVDQPQHEWPNWAGEMGERLARLAAECPREVEVQAFLAHGDVGAEIERFAVQHGADAVVLVRRSQLQPGRARTLRSVLERSSCPVLILSGPED